MSSTPVLTNVTLKDGEIVVHNYQDVEDIIESNKRWQTEEQKGDFRKIAEIPTNLIYQWLNEEYWRGNTTITWASKEMDKIIERKLRDPDYAYLRTGGPRLIVGYGD